MTTGTKSARTVGTGIALGIVATVLIYGHAVGLGASLYIVLWLVLIFVHARFQDKTPVPRNLLLLIPTAFFALTCLIRADEDLLTINVLVGASALMLLTYFFTNGNFAFQNLFEYPVKALISGADVVFLPAQELTGSIKWLASRRDSWHKLTPFMRGAAITIPLVAVFVILLSSADEIFGRMVSSLFSAITLENLPNSIAELGFGTLFAWVAIGVLSTSLMDRTKAKRTAPLPASPADEAKADAPSNDPPPAPPPPSAHRFDLGFTETTMALAGVLVVFAAFVAIQFVYLFGGVQNIANFSYAEYVHRGFIELVIVAVLTLGLMFVLNAATIRDTSRKDNIFRGLGTVLIVLTMVILASAFQRLRLYELTYGFTSLRLTIYVTILWLGVLFVGMGASLYWKPSTIKVFETTALIAVFGFAVTLDLLNPDAFVAWQNINRGDVDPVYLASLSVEAVPALVTLIDAPEPGLRAIIRDTLARRLADLQWYRSADWRDFSLGYSNAIAALDSVKDKLSNPSTTTRGTGYKIDDFKTTMQVGMTVRAAYRQFGYPFTIFSPGQRDYTGRISSVYYRMAYQLGDGRWLYLGFDTARGLLEATACDNKDVCQGLPLLPQS